MGRVTLLTGPERRRRWSEEDQRRILRTEPKPPRAKRRAPRQRIVAIEMEASGVTVRIGDGTSFPTIAAVKQPHGRLNPSEQPSDALRSVGRATSPTEANMRCHVGRERDVQGPGNRIDYFGRSYIENMQESRGLG